MDRSSGVLSAVCSEVHLRLNLLTPSSKHVITGALLIGHQHPSTFALGASTVFSMFSRPYVNVMERPFLDNSLREMVLSLALQVGERKVVATYDVASALAAAIDTCYDQVVLYLKDLDDRYGIGGFQRVVLGSTVPCYRIGIIDAVARDALTVAARNGPWEIGDVHVWVHDTQLTIVSQDDERPLAKIHMRERDDLRESFVLLWETPAFEGRDSLDSLSWNAAYTARWIFSSLLGFVLGDRNDAYTSAYEAIEAVSCSEPVSVDVGTSERLDFVERLLLSAKRTPDLLCPLQTLHHFLTSTRRTITNDLRRQIVSALLIALRQKSSAVIHDRFLLVDRIEYFEACLSAKVTLSGIEAAHILTALMGVLADLEISDIEIDSIVQHLLGLARMHDGIVRLGLHLNAVEL